MKMRNKILEFGNLTDLKKENKSKKVVHCHGVFDLLHHGHLKHFCLAKNYGDILVVTITPDRFVNKGPGRPHFTEAKRAEMLAALEVVDYVAINEAPTAIPAIGALKPDFFVKGPDYKNKDSDITGAILEEEDAVRSVGGKLVFTDDETDSSTRLINAFLSPWDEDQKKAIDDLKAGWSILDLLGLIDRMKGLKVLVIGEPIVDTYIFCQPENLSSKSPSISSRFISREDYAGGSLAIGRHLDALGCDVTLLYTHGGEDYFLDLLARYREETACQVESVELRGIPTPRKTRYIEPFGAQRMFELIDVRHDQWEHADPSDFIEILSRHSISYDMTMVADFGHGLLEGPVLEQLNKAEGVIALNVQTNSENYGFNRFDKHEHYDYLSIDERECRLGMHDRSTPIEQLAKQTYERIHKPFSITLGGRGSLYFDPDGKEYFCPTYFREVIDTTGAGDAYFMMSSLLRGLGAFGIAIPFLSNLFAGLKTRIIGNSKAVQKVDLIRTVESLLS